MTETRPTIALVDDDLRMLESLGDLLEASGYRTVAFQSATTLLAAGLLGVDLIVADIGMPGMDGLELRDIALRDRPDLPVFLITGRHELADRGRTERISPVFQKPFDAPALLVAIDQALHPAEHGG